MKQIIFLIFFFFSISSTNAYWVSPKWQDIKNTVEISQISGIIDDNSVPVDSVYYGSFIGQIACGSNSVIQTSYSNYTSSFSGFTIDSSGLWVENYYDMSQSYVNAIECSDPIEEPTNTGALTSSGIYTKFEIDRSQGQNYAWLTEQEYYELLIFELTIISLIVIVVFIKRLIDYIPNSRRKGKK